MGTEDNLAEMLDQQRWLLNNGLVPDSVKNQLFFCGSIVHEDVQAVEVKLHPDKKQVEYTIYINKSLMKKIETYNKLSTATSLFSMWKFKRFLKKEGSLDFKSILSKFVGDFCGPGWTVKMTTLDFDVYVDNIGEEESGSGEQGQQLNKLPD